MCATTLAGARCLGGERCLDCRRVPGVRWQNATVRSETRDPSSEGHKVNLKCPAPPSLPKLKHAAPCTHTLSTLLSCSSSVVRNAKAMDLLTPADLPAARSRETSSITLAGFAGRLSLWASRTAGGSNSSDIGLKAQCVDLRSHYHNQHHLKLKNTILHVNHFDLGVPICQQTRGRQSQHRRRGEDHQSVIMFDYTL